MVAVRTDLIVGDDQVTKALRKQAEEIDRLKAKMQGLATTSKRATRSGSDGLIRMAKQAGAAALGYVSVSKAIQLVNAELQRQITLQDKSAGIAKSIGAAQIQVAALLGSDLSDKQRKAFFAEVKGIAGDRGQVPFLQAAGRILSATKGQAPQALQALRAVRPFTLGKPELLGDLGTLVPGIASAAGISIDDAAALAFKALQQSRIEETGQLTTVGKALTAGELTRGAGESKVEAAKNAIALNAVFGARVQDITGAQSALATGGLLRGLKRAAPGGRTFAERLDIVGADPKKIELATSSGFRGITKDVAIALLEGRGGLQEEFRGVRGGLDLDREKFGALAAFSAGGKGSTPEIKALARAVTSEGVTERFVGRPILQIKGDIRKALRSATTEAGGFSSNIFAGATQALLQTGTPEEQIEFARGRITAQINEVTSRAFPGGRLLRPVTPDIRERVERFRTAEDQLDVLAEELRGIRANQRPPVQVNAAGLDE